MIIILPILIKQGSRRDITYNYTSEIIKKIAKKNTTHKEKRMRKSKEWVSHLGRKNRESKDRLGAWRSPALFGVGPEVLDSTEPQLGSTDG